MGKIIKFYTNVMNSVYKQSPEVFHKKDVLKNFTFLEITCFGVSFLKKLQALMTVS